MWKNEKGSVGTKVFIVVLILLISVILLFWLYNQIKYKVKNGKVIIPTTNINEMIVIVCLMITVIIRGYVGLILSFEWKSNFILALISIFAVVFGKMLGGIIGDKIGFMKVSLISLIVSSIMIGIITYISVLERTKEIGILRAIGASKRDISRVFNAETFITGLVSGLIGIGVTILLTIPINSIIMSVTGVNVEAFLPWQAGIILVLISILGVSAIIIAIRYWKIRK